ncbi:MAG TPA: hypothetical protein VGB77_07580 [Abditibacteriaceae bacterium]|jgi:hypothetical protein
MAKIVSEKRENSAINQQATKVDGEPTPSTFVNLLGIGLVALFVIGAVVTVVMVLQVKVGI